MATGTDSTPAPAAGTVKANLVALGVAEAVARLAQLLTIALLGRALGPEGLGIVGVAWAVYQLAIPFVQYAPELMGARDVARGEAIDAIFVDLTAVKLMVAALSAALIAAGAAAFFAGDTTTQLQLLAQCPLLIAVALNGVWAFRGLRRFAAYAVIRSANSVGLLACLAAILWVFPRPVAVPIAETAAGLAAALLAYALLLGWRSLAETAARTIARLRGLGPRIGEAIQFGLGSFFAGATWSIPLLAGRAFLDPAAQGHLAASIRLLLAVSALYQLALQVFHPVLAHRYSVDRAAGRNLAAALVVYALATTIPGSIALAVAAPWIVKPLLGAEFAPAASVLAALAPTLIPTIIGSVFGYALMADGRYRLYVAICAGGAAAAVIGCGLAFYVVPRPEAAGVLVLVVTLVGLAAGVATWRLGLVSFAHVTWDQLSPQRVQAVLRER